MQIKFNDYEPKEIIYIIREWTNLTQKEFGKRINKSERTIQDYEAGKRKYNVETLKKLCDLYNIEIIITKKGKQKTL